LAAVPGIGEKMAQSIIQSLNTSFTAQGVDMQTGEILDA
jgi:Holliday junction resolvasome RuvABC DNA-binding subunit